MVALFKIWFNLVKAFLYCLFYIILGPLMIVFGLLPTKPLGFESWIRRLFINIAIFPITAYIIVAARVLMEIYDKDNLPGQFIPPLIGHNANANFGPLIALGALILAPTIQQILRDKMGVKTIGTPGAIGAGLASGAAVVGAPVGRAMKHLNRYDPRTGDTGALAQLKRTAGEKTLNKLASTTGIKSFKKAAARRKLIEEGGTVFKRDVATGKEVSMVDETAANIGKRRKNARWARNARASATRRDADSAKILAERAKAEAIAKAEAKKEAKKAKKGGP
jgi:hypothetical protein